MSFCRHVEFIYANGYIYGQNNLTNEYLDFKIVKKSYQLVFLDT